MLIVIFLTIRASLYQARPGMSTCRRSCPLVRFKITHRRNHFRAEELDRAHQIFLGNVANIEFTKNGIEQAFACGGFDLFRHGLPGSFRFIKFSASRW
jgi:hypothetical protein